MRLFKRKSDDCTAHHYPDEPSKFDKFRIYREQDQYCVEQKVSYTCQHEGCKHTRTTWEIVGYRAANPLDNVLDE